MFGEWYDEETMQKLRFYDDNTRSWWETATGERAHRGQAWGAGVGAGPFPPLALLAEVALFSACCCCVPPLLSLMLLPASFSALFCTRLLSSPPAFPCLDGRAAGRLCPKAA